MTCSIFILPTVYIVTLSAVTLSGYQTLVDHEEVQLCENQLHLCELEKK